MRVRGSKRKSEDLDDRDDTPHRLVKLHGSSFGFLRRSADGEGRQTFEVERRKRAEQNDILRNVSLSPSCPCVEDEERTGKKKLVRESVPVRYANRFVNCSN
jgi:hypothetical protein